MAKAIPNPYEKADRTLLDKIEADRPCNNGILADFWKVGSAVCERGCKGYYYIWTLEKDPFYGKIVRKYRIDKYGKMVETKDFYKVPTKTDYILWCADRNITVSE